MLSSTSQSSFLGPGGGNVLNVQRTIKQFIAAGAKGCTLEDQKWPKKSGSVRGKEVIGMDEHIAKVSDCVISKCHFCGEAMLDSGKKRCARDKGKLWIQQTASLV